MTTSALRRLQMFQLCFIVLNVAIGAVLGCLLQVVRDAVYTMLAGSYKLDLIPRVTEWVLFLPSKEFFPKHYTYLQLMVLVSITFGMLVQHYCLEKAGRPSRRLLALNLTVFALGTQLFIFFALLLIMVYPVLPNLKLLSVSPLPSTVFADFISGLFWIGIIAFLGVSIYRVVKAYKL